MCVCVCACERLEGTEMEQAIIWEARAPSDAGSNYS